MKKWLFLISLLVANQAFAHPGHDASFVVALSHPMTGWDHLLTMLIVGIMAYIFPTKKGMALPLIFVSFFSISAAVVSGLQVGGQHIELLNQLILISLIVLPVIHLFIQKLSFSIVAFFIALIGGFHGLTHGVELDVTSTLVISGLILSTILIHAIGYLVAVSLSRKNEWYLKAFTMASGVFAATVFVQSI